MKIIYYSNNSTYAAYAMAAIHIGIYGEDVLPCLDYILRQWELCFTYSSQKGNLIYMGLDEELREVYIIGCGNNGEMIEKAYNGFNNIYDIREENYYIDANRWEGNAYHLVALSLRFPYLEPIARRLFIYWFKRSYSRWQEKVQREKGKIEERIEL